MDDPDLIWKQAQVDLQAGRIDAASHALSRLQALRPPTDEDWLLTGQVRMANGRDDEALASLLQIPDSSPLAAKSRRLAGQLELRRKRARHAETYLREALRLDPDEAQARRELVFIYGMQLRREPLGEVFRGMAERQFVTADDAFLWSLSRSAVWRAEEQSETLREFLDADPDDRWSRIALADCLKTMGKLDEMEALLDPLTDDDPEARARRAEIAITRGDLDRAERLLAEGPEAHAALSRLRGTLALRRRDAEAAIRHYRAAEALEPDHRDTLFGLARAYTIAGDEEAARPYLESSEKLEAVATLVQYAATPEGRADENLPLRMGEACAKAGRTDEAWAWYRIAVARDPLNRDAQTALYRLEADGKWSEDSSTRR